MKKIENKKFKLDQFRESYYYYFSLLALYRIDMSKRKENGESEDIQR